MCFVVVGKQDGVVGVLDVGVFGLDNPPEVEQQGHPGKRHGQGDQASVGVGHDQHGCRRCQAADQGDNEADHVDDEPRQEVGVPLP